MNGKHSIFVSVFPDPSVVDRCMTFFSCVSGAWLLHLVNDFFFFEFQLLVNNFLTSLMLHTAFRASLSIWSCLFKMCGITLSKKQPKQSDFARKNMSTCQFLLLLLLLLLFCLSASSSSSASSSLHHLQTFAKSNF